MFENLEVKDPREACKRFKELLDKERIRHAEKLNKIEKEHAKKERDHELSSSRRDVRIDELKHELEQTKESLANAVTKERFEKRVHESKAAIDKWAKAFQENEERWKSMDAKAVSTPCSSIQFHLLTCSRRKQHREPSPTRANIDTVRRST